MNKKLLFASPYSYHRPNRIAQAKTAKALRDEGFEIHWLSAEVSKALVQVDRNDEEIDWCLKFDKQLSKRLGFKLICPPIPDLIDLASEARTGVEGIRTIEEVELAGVDCVGFGHYCLADTLVRERFSDFDSSLLQSKVLRALLFDSFFCGNLASLIAASESYDAVFCYIAGYAPHRTLCEIFEKRGTEYCSYEGGINYGSFFTLIRAYMGNQIDGMLGTRTFGNEVCLTRKASAERIVTGSAHLAVSMGKGVASHCFSEKPGGVTGGEIRRYFDIRENQKLILAVTSSEDEMRAATVNKQPQLWDELFATQREWLDCLLKFFEGNQELFLVIRIHPREFFGGVTENARELVAFLQDLPVNVRLNVPADGLSLYDLAKETELLLFNYSSCGSEFLQLGIPVIKYCESLMYPTRHGMLVNESVDAYEKAVLSHVGVPLEPNQLLEVFRWVACLRSGNLVDIGIDRFSIRRRLGRFGARIGTKFLKVLRNFSIFTLWSQRLQRRLDLKMVVGDVGATVGEGRLLSRLIAGRPVVDSRLEERVDGSGEWGGIEKVLNCYAELVYGCAVDSISVDEPLARRFKGIVSLARESS